jgi:chromosome partitioning protein
VGEPERENKLKWAISLLKDDYDYIFIDTPPSLGLLTLNALTAADCIIIPLQCEYYSLEGISQLLNTVNLVKERLNPQLEIEGVLLTMADFRTKLTGEVINEIKSYFAGKVYNVIIPRSVKVAESPGYGKPIFLYDPHSTAALKYKEVGDEFLRRNQELEAAFREQSEKNEERANLEEASLQEQEEKQEVAEEAIEEKEA